MRKEGVIRLISCKLSTLPSATLPSGDLCLVFLLLIDEVKGLDTKGYVRLLFNNLILYQPLVLLGKVYFQDTFIHSQTVGSPTTHDSSHSKLFSGCLSRPTRETTVSVTDRPFKTEMFTSVLSCDNPE